MTSRPVKLWCAAALFALLPQWAAAAPRPADGVKGSTAPADAPHDGTAADEQQPPPPPPTSPLTIHVGDADLTVGGFMDATFVGRSVYTGNGLGTNFGGNPFSNSPQGNINESRFSAQNSRVTLQATSKTPGGGNVKGYLEADFLGNAPNGLNVTSNSNTLRMRLYWVQYTQGKFEFLAGQSWSMLTPNRNGLSPMPGDLFYGQEMDTNYQMGLTWGRTTQFRFIAHATDSVTAGISLENPEQYVGSAVTLPASFPGFQVDAGGVATNVPNPYPDIIGKIAFDPKTGSTHQHVDAAFLVRGFSALPSATSTTPQTAIASGGEINVNVEPVKNFHLIGSAFFSSGGGRYIANTNVPDLIVNADGSLSLVKSRSYIVGPEITLGKTLLYAYYSETHADSAVTTDVNGKLIGYGIPGAAAANEKIKEPTIGFVQTFFRDPKIGGMQLIFQYSYLNRTPFSVPVGAPSAAKMNMVYVDVRYLLP